jgi:large subunit ribosomal protein L1
MHRKESHMAKTKQSKRYQSAVKVADLAKDYTLSEAVEVLGKFPKVKFDETVELSVRLGVDPTQGDQMVRGTTPLPNGSGKKVRIVVFTDNPEAAIAAGADHAGLQDIMLKVNEGWLDFDVAIATTEAMKQVRTLARVLGPKGLMPNPKSGTVTDDIAAGIKAVKAGRVEFKMDKAANIGVGIGKLSFTPAQIVENASTVIDAITKAKPASFKGVYVKSITLSSSMSPGIRVSPSAISQS